MRVKGGCKHISCIDILYIFFIVLNVYVYERGETLGLIHSHSHFGIYMYVLCFYSTASAFNFNKMNTNNLNTPYDYSSVMQYGR